MFKFIASSLLAIVALSLPAPSVSLSFSFPGEFPRSSEDSFVAAAGSPASGDNDAFSGDSPEVDESSLHSSGASSGASLVFFSGASPVSSACFVGVPPVSLASGLSFSAPSLSSSSDSGSVILEDCIDIPEERIVAPTQSMDINAFFLDNVQYPSQSRKRRREDDNEYDNGDVDSVPVDHERLVKRKKRRHYYLVRKTKLLLDYDGPYTEEHWVWTRYRSERMIWYFRQIQ
ncbi:hypothetical protein BDB01DRAFT_852766 [Pilobolus umbonatus]|nr:hypothetical protein BDB01DRAFT_852766 [Pilobolus umbonatus]